jgi:hypothetical protein
MMSYFAPSFKTSVCHFAPGSYLGVSRCRATGGTVLHVDHSCEDRMMCVHSVMMCYNMDQKWRLWPCCLGENRD